MSETRLRWGILGTARIARRLIEGVRKGHEGVIAAVASRDAERAREWAKGYDIPKVFGSYEALLHSGEVDLIYNPLPNSLHAEWTLAALDAGLPVLCEKPFTATLAEAEAVAAASRKSGIPVMEAFMYRYHPVYRKMEEILASGWLGDIRSLYAKFTYNLGNRYIVQADPALAGGVLMDLGCYCLDFGRLVMGTLPVEVFGSERRDDIDRSFWATMRYENGVRMQFEAGFESQHEQRVAIGGSLGNLIIERPWHPGNSRDSVLLQLDGEERRIEVEGDDGYRMEADDLAHAWRTGKSPRWNADDAVETMRVIEALYRSAKLNRPVEV